MPTGKNKGQSGKGTKKTTATKSRAKKPPALN